MSFKNVGKVWSRQSFVPGIAKPAWVKGITLHHTGAPSLATRPHGLTIQHVENIQDFYKTKRGWSSGPHLFIDEDQIFGMTPLHERGIHATSFNSTHIGIEVLGEFDSERHDTGRGMECWLTAAYAIIALRRAWGPLPLNLHRDDPRTNKTCAGKPVTVAWIETLVDLASDEHPSFPRRATLEETLGSKLIPVMDFVRAHGHMAPLARKGAQTYLGSWRLETGHYDATKQTTLATEHELQCWLASQPE